jgi:hypothetical protein
LTEAGNVFAEGFYVNNLTVTVKTGVLKFGVTKTEHIGTDWTVWDNFRLTYNGKLDEPVPAIDEAIAKLDLAIKAADEKLASYAAGDALFQYSEAELAPLANAIAAANEAKAAEDATEESINAAKTALNEAVEAFAPKATLLRRVRHTSLHLLLLRTTSFQFLLTVSRLKQRVLLFTS